MAKAKIRKINLPDAPNPTKASRYKDPREIERAKRIQEHNNINFDKTKDRRLCFWDSARTAKLRRLWEEGFTVSYIAREVGCEESVCRDRIRYEIKCGRAKRRRKEATEEQIQSIINRYKAGESLSAISKEMMLSRYYVTNILVKEGVKQ